MKRAVDNAPSYQSSGRTSPSNPTGSDHKSGAVSSVGSSAIVGAAAGGGYQQDQSQLHNGTISGSSTMTIQENVPMSTSVGITEMPAASTAGTSGPPPTPGVLTGGDKTPLLQADLLKSLSGGVGFSNVNRPEGLSTFAGVFCPVATSMVSVLFFLRLGKIISYFCILDF